MTPQTGMAFFNPNKTILFPVTPGGVSVGAETWRRTYSLPVARTGWWGMRPATKNVSSRVLKGINDVFPPKACIAGDLDALLVECKLQCRPLWRNGCNRVWLN